MRKNLLSIFALAVLMVVSSLGFAQTTFTKINSVDELVAGENYLIVAHYDDLGVLAMGYQNTNNRKALVVTENDNAISVVPGTDPNDQNSVFQFTLGGSTNAWTFFDEVKGGYLYAASSSANNLKTQTVLDANGQWSISFNDDGTAEVIAQGNNERNNMRFNPNTQNNAPLFSCYASSSNINTRVSFYKAGAAVVNPEPSNYPTNFTALVDDLKITLRWNDATGAQLPSKYLVVGSLDEIDVPEDGTPVENGALTKNVSYGEQSVTFEGLAGNTTYSFAIFPYTNSGANIDYKTDGDYPTARVTTPQIDVLLEEGFDDGLGMFTALSLVGEQEWAAGEYGGVNFAGINGYSGGAHANEDWLISPEIGFGRDATVLEFCTGMNFNGPALSVKVSCDYTSGAPVTDGYWEDITDLFDYSNGGYEWVESGQVDITPYLTNQLGYFHIAFVYTSTDEAAALWRVDYVRVFSGMVSVEEHPTTNVAVYPNPAQDVVSFDLMNDAQVSIFDVTGRMVSTMNMVAGQGQCQIANLENGVYFLNIRYADGKKEVARFVKF